jgi:5-methylcytosine-specific restriction protein A
MNKAPTMSSFRPKLKDNRPSAHKRGYGSRWRRIRRNHLAGEPLCRECRKMNKITAATIVDHIIPHKGDMVLFYAPDNRQSLCKTHHDIKTATEDGGFGHKMKA